MLGKNNGPYNIGTQKLQQLKQERRYSVMSFSELFLLSQTSIVVAQKSSKKSTCDESVQLSNHLLSADQIETTDYLPRDVNFSEELHLTEDRFLLDHKIGKSFESKSSKSFESKSFELKSFESKSFENKYQSHLESPLRRFKTSRGSYQAKFLNVLKQTARDADFAQPFCDSSMLVPSFDDSPSKVNANYPKWSNFETSQAFEGSFVSHVIAGAYSNRRDLPSCDPELLNLPAKSNIGSFYKDFYKEKPQRDYISLKHSSFKYNHIFDASTLSQKSPMTQNLRKYHENPQDTSCSSNSAITECCQPIMYPIYSQTNLNSNLNPDSSSDLIIEGGTSTPLSDRIPKRTKLDFSPCFRNLTENLPLADIRFDPLQPEFPRISEYLCNHIGILPQGLTGVEDIKTIHDSEYERPDIKNEYQNGANDDELNQAGVLRPAVFFHGIKKRKKLPSIQEMVSERTLQSKISTSLKKASEPRINIRILRGIGPERLKEKYSSRKSVSTGNTVNSAPTFLVVLTFLSADLRMRVNECLKAQQVTEATSEKDNVLVSAQDVDIALLSVPVRLKPKILRKTRKKKQEQVKTEAKDAGDTKLISPKKKVAIEMGLQDWWRYSVGCWTCRIRRKSCPQDGEICSACVRLKLVCDRALERPKYMLSTEDGKKMKRYIKAQTDEVRKISTSASAKRRLSVASQKKLE